MAGTSRAWVGVALVAGFAAGWFARDALVEAPPAPVPVVEPDAGTEVDAGPPAPPAVDPLALALTDRAAAIAWWATAPASPMRDAFEHSLALPAGVGFFDYLAPVYERAGFDEPDAGEPASLGFFVDRAGDGRTCRYLAGRVPLAQGGLRVGRACDELTTTPPRWLVVRLGDAHLLFDVASRKLATRADSEQTPAFLFGVDATGRFDARTASTCRWKATDGEARELAVSPEIEAFAASEVRPLATVAEPVQDRTRISSPWLDGAMTMRANGERRTFSPADASEERSAVVEGAWEWRAPLAMPGRGGYFVVFGSSAGADAGEARRMVVVTCDAERCVADQSDFSAD